MAGSESSHESKSELAELKEQLAEVLKVVSALQKEKTPADNTQKEDELLPPPGFPKKYTHQAAGTIQKNVTFDWAQCGLPKGYIPQYEDGTYYEEHLKEQPHMDQLTEHVDLTGQEDDDPNYEPPQKTTQPKVIPHLNQKPTWSYHDNVAYGGPSGGNPQGHKREDLEKWSMIEERLKVVEGANNPDLKDAYEMCLVPDVVLPYKFKAPEFEKYDGTSCPKSHLHMYVRKMTAYHGNDKLMIHCFQDSLVGMAISWYIELDKAHIRTFRDLSNAFVRQYKYNENAAPDRIQLQNMSKKPTESFKEYAQRWRGVASQVKPHLEEQEQVNLFLETLQNPYYDRLIGLVSLGFNELAKTGERIELGMRNGRILDEQADSSVGKKPNFVKKKEGETNSVNSKPKVNQVPQPNYTNPNSNPYIPQLYQAPYPPYLPNNYIATNTHQYHAPPPFPQTRPYNNQPYHHRPNQNTYQAPNANPAQNQNNFQNQPRRNPYFDPIPMSYAELFSYLQSQGVLSPIDGKIIDPPYPKWYDPNASCAYHRGIAGHSIENCRILKYKVQDLIDSKRLDFNQVTPNTTENPFPNHEK